MSENSPEIYPGDLVQGLGVGKHGTVGEIEDGLATVWEYIRARNEMVPRYERSDRLIKMRPNHIFRVT